MAGSGEPAVNLPVFFLIFGMATDQEKDLDDWTSDPPSLWQKRWDFGMRFLRSKKKDGQVS